MQKYEKCRLLINMKKLLDSCNLYYVMNQEYIIIILHCDY